ncbi:MAG: hypothetical protein KF884_08660 [Fimbriimonadaceae bacterium]|nr:hypothetical protein [Fimbriimonadaceae bacterium]QYK57620.1 MAG: hypothetical protein KF884_08660 [Fimbriimonadaceae bacterium]
MNTSYLSFRLTLTAFFVAAMSSISAPLFAGQLQVFKQGKSGQVMKVDTATFFPQISEGMNQRRITPTNPKVESLRQGQTNSLRAGGFNRLSAPLAGARFPGMDFTGSFPPDPQIAVSSTHVVQVVNSDIAFFDKKTGTKQFQQGLARGLFRNVNPTDFVFDPKTFYDKTDKRFYVVALELLADDSFILVAVSDDGDPRGIWNTYRINSKSVIGQDEFWLDYPGFGGNKDGVVVTGNMFPLGSAGQVHVQHMVINKADLKAGRIPTVTRFLDLETFTVQVCKNEDPASPYAFGVSLDTTSRLRVYGYSNLASAPAVSFDTVDVPSFNFIGSAPSLNRSNDSLSGRLMEAMFQNGSIVTAHTTRATTGARRAVVSWYDIRVNRFPASGAPTLSQAGTVAMPGEEHAYMPAIWKNERGDMSIAFTRSSRSIAGDAMVASRRVSDPQGTIGTPRVYRSSLAANLLGRWGDYFSVQTDPDNDNLFWAVHQVIPSNGRWSTEISNWVVGVSGGLNDTNNSLAELVRRIEGGTTTGGLSQIRLSDGSSFEVNSARLADDSQAASLECSFTSKFGQADAESLEIRAKVRATTGRTPTGMLFVWNVSTRKWEYLKAQPITDAFQTMEVTLLSNARNYIDANRKILVRVRGLDSVRRRGVSPLPFRLTTDTVQVAVGPRG